MEPKCHCQVRSQSWDSAKAKVTRVQRAENQQGEHCIKRSAEVCSNTQLSTDQLMPVRKLSEAKERNAQKRLERDNNHSSYGAMNNTYSFYPEWKMI